MGFLFSILAAAGFGGTLNLIQLGLRTGRVKAADGMIVNLLASNLVLLVALGLSLAVKPVVFHASGILFFILAGLMAPLFGRGASFLAIPRIGSTRTSALAICECFFAAPLAFLLLGQRVTLMSVAGITIVAAGTILFILETRRLAGTPDDLAKGTLSSGTVLAGVGFALGSGLFFGLAGIFRQLGVDAIPSAVVGAAVGTLVALLIYGANVVRRGRLVACLRMPRREALFFASSGVTGSIGQVAFFLALDHHASVAVATAVKNTSPLFTFTFAALFLSRKEKLGLRLGVLAGVVVIGAILAAIGRV